MQLFAPIRWKALDEHRLSAAALAASNMLPLVGVLAFGWQAFDLVFLYWMENVVIGAVNVLKIRACQPDLTLFPPEKAVELADRFAFSSADQRQRFLNEFEPPGHVEKPLPTLRPVYVPFFLLHYGLFCFVHLVFICATFGNTANLYQPALDALGNFGVLLATAGLLISHMVSYFTNFLAKGEFRRTVPMLLMLQPYARVVVLHLAIIASALFVLVLDAPAWLLATLVLGKTVLDLSLHLREHQKLEAPA